MDCTLIQREDGRWYCPRCERSLSQKARRHCIVTGPGDKLQKVLKNHRLRFNNCAKEQAFFGMMNNWGPETCLEHREDILDWVVEKAVKASLPELADEAEQIVEAVLSLSAADAVE